MLKDKRGMSIDSMIPVVTLLVLIGIVMGLGLYVMNQTNEAISTTTNTVANETLTTVTQTGETVATSTDCGFRDFAVTTAYNATAGNGTVIGSGNYTVSANEGIVYAADSQFNNTDWNVTYTYTGDEGVDSCEALETSLTGLSGFADWIAVIVVVIAAAIVLGIVMSSFGRRSGI